MTVPTYFEQSYPLGEIEMPPFEDAHSIQSVIRQVVQMVLQKRLEQKTASLLLYALQIASSNLKRMELEKPQPAEVVTDPESMDSENMDQQTGSQTNVETANQEATGVNTNHQINHNANQSEKTAGKNPPPGTITIQACHRPRSQTPTRVSHQQRKQYVN